MKIKFYDHKIKCPIYNKTIYIKTFPCQKTLDKINAMRMAFDKNEEPLSLNECAACFTELSPKDYMLLFFESPTINTIAHECFHLTMYLFKEIGHEINDLPSQEAPAYFIGWLIEQTTKKLIK